LEKKREGKKEKGQNPRRAEDTEKRMNSSLISAQKKGS